MSDRLIRRMLAFVEFADVGDPDMVYAVRMAQQLRAELILFAVIDTPAMVALIGRHKAMASKKGETLTAALVEDAKAILQRLVDEAAERGVAARGHAIVSEEVPEQILKEAIVQHVDLILIRPSGRHGFLHRMLRSTVEEVLSAAPCPVVVAAGGSLGRTEE
jgi:nucleotide-binding universal stress UspA family protein